MPHKILVVDDDKDTVYFLKTTLQKEGYEVATAPNGEQALNALKDYVPDLIISDLTMPVMNGWYFSMKVRSDERYKTTPIIILSGLLDHTAAPEEFEAATFYVPKPFDIFELVGKVKELLKGP
ncbi:MAG: response regulator [Candidatus Omnitrophica bacterium]|nr:response regulator [Candidatus Omnitrophota bacterium]MDE2008743.1 response regulator [Candidatus Omnitrophota bacterium]